MSSGVKKKEERTAAAWRSGVVEETLIAGQLHM